MTTPDQGIARGPIRVAVAGSGRWGKNQVRVWHSLGHLRAICDTSEERRREATANYPDAFVTSEFDELLQGHSFDAVVIATPAETHVGLALKAISAGKHVLVEKPLALNLIDARRIHVAAEASDLVVGVGHVLEYHPAVQSLRQTVESGDLGKIRYLYSHRLNLGRVRSEENALWSFAPHDVALMLRVIGSLPTEVTCRGGAYIQPDIADVTLMSMSFPSNVMAHLFVSWLHPFKVQRFVVVGSEQMATFDDTAPWSEKLVLYPHSIEMSAGRPPIARSAEAVPVDLVPDEPLKKECEHFIKAIEEKTRPLTDTTSAVRVLQVLEAGSTSLAAGGAPVKIE